MATNRPRSLIKRNAGVGLDPGSGQTLDLDLNELSAKTTPAMADSVALVDSDDDSSKKATLTNCLKILGETAAGTNATSALSEVDGVMRVDVGNTTPTTAPAPADKMLVEVGGVNKSASITNIVKAVGEAMVNSATATSGVSEVDGVVRVDIGNVTANTSPASANKVLVEQGGVNKSITLANMAAFYGAMAQMVADLKSSLFITALEFDAGTTLAVDTKLSDSLEAKGQLIAVIGVVTELFNGTADSSVIVSKAALGATPMASAIVMDKDSVQVVGSVVGAWPVAGADSIQAAEGDVYAYVTTDDSRSTGKIGFVLLWMKTA